MSLGGVTSHHKPYKYQQCSVAMLRSHAALLHHLIASIGIKYDTGQRPLAHWPAKSMQLHTRAH